MVVAGAALHARQAHVEQLERDAVALREARDAFAERLDLAGALVAKDEARRHGELAAVEVQVAAADADAAHAHEHLTRLRLRDVDVVQLERAGAGDGCLFHVRCSLCAGGAPALRCLRRTSW